nr:Ig-like domain-containing protein [Leifsonia sp. C5G2]
MLSAVGLIGDAPPASATAPPGQHAGRIAEAPAVSAAPSSAAPNDTSTPSDTPTATPTPTPVTLDTLPAGLVTSFPLTVSGSGTPGDRITASAGSSPGAPETCQATVDGSERWTCALASLPDGEGVAVRAESASTGSADSGRVKVLHPPVIAGDGVVATGGGVRGTAFPNATVTVTADTGASCTFPADGNGSWGCVLTGDLPDGRHTVTATQVAPFSSQRSGTSARVAIDVDRTAPGAPSITTPKPATRVTAGRPAAFGGGGENGAHVTLYATNDQGTTVVCTADVTDGAWACQGTLPEGAFRLSALQRDAAGNVSAGSNTVPVDGIAAATPSPTQTPSPTPTPTVPAPAAPGAAPPSGPLHPDTRGWVATPFTTTSAPVVTAASLPGWMRAAGLAVAALLLLVLPARLLTAALARGRAQREARPRSSLFGRNRPRADVADASALFGRDRGGARTGPVPTAAGAASGSGGRTPAGQPRWLAPVTLAATAVLVTFSTPLPDAGAYLRVLLAVAIAVAAVNTVWVLAGRALATHLRLPSPHLTVRPGLLAVVAVAAVGSRLLGLTPALLFAMVLAVTVGPHAGRVRRGRVAAVQISAVAALGVLAWLAVGVLPAPTGWFSALLVELVNALTLVGIGSAAVLLLPVGGLAGRAVAQWSRWLWGGLSLVVYTVLFALLLPVASLVERGVGVVVIVGVAAGFAAASVAFWLWERYVAPAIDRSLR